MRRMERAMRGTQTLSAADMIFTEYWQRVTRKYPTFAREDAVVQIKVSAIKAFMQESHGHGRELGKGVAKFEQQTGKAPDNPFQDLFKPFTGK